MKPARIHTSKRSIVLALLCVATIMTPRFNAAQDGVSWKKWSSQQQTAFVLGFVQGYQESRLKLCSAIELRQTAEQRNSSTFRECEASTGYMVETDRLIRDVTDFYAHYPEFRYVSLHDLLERLIGGTKLDDVHSMMMKNPPINRSATN